MADDNPNVTTLKYALAERDGKWAAYFIAANATDANLANAPLISAWMDTREAAEVKVNEVIEDMARMGLKIVPLRPPS